MVQYFSGRLAREGRVVGNETKVFVGYGYQIALGDTGVGYRDVQLQREYLTISQC